MATSESIGDPTRRDLVTAMLLPAGALLGLAFAVLATRMGAGSLAPIGGLGLPLVAALQTIRRLHRRHAEEREVVATAVAERDALRREVASTVHDLRGALVTVHSYVELLGEGAFGELPKAAQEATERGLRAAALARSLAESSLRASLGMREASPGPVAVALESVLEDVRASLDTELRESGAYVDVGALPTVSAERDALYRVFSNLLENAIKYSLPGRRPRVAITAYEDGEQCQISVRDWGPGIPPDERELVFDHGFRGAQSASRDGAFAAGSALPGSGPAGSGLGLATVQKLINEQGGRVWLDPVVEGTCVRLELPLSRTR